MNLTNLKNSLQAVAPVKDICIGVESDSSTWTMTYTDTPTDDEIAAAQAIIDAWDEETEQAALEQVFKDACTQFRTVCASIEALLLADGTLSTGETFTGGFDEMATFQNSSTWNTDDGVRLGVAWAAANEQGKYEGAKLGYEQPEWWSKCWEYAESE